MSETATVRRSTARVALFVPLILELGCTATARFSGTLPRFAMGERFVTVGDLQRTSCLEFWRESNDTEREVLVRAIAAEHPAFVAMTGDLVFDGSSADDWEQFDELMTLVHAANVPVFATFGNHEYFWGRGGETRFYARFPHQQGLHDYWLARGPLRLIVLDDNIDRLTDVEWRGEMQRYESALEAFDCDPTVRGVIVLLHHPPYTNSIVTGDEEYVQRFIARPFARTQKALAMISGHVHSYERFQEKGKTYLVSGGGGGPRAELATGADRRHPDNLYPGGAVRFFHYVRFAITDTGLDAEVVGLDTGDTAVAVMDAFQLAWPTPADRSGAERCSKGVGTSLAMRCLAPPSPLP